MIGTIDAVVLAVVRALALGAVDDHVDAAGLGLVVGVLARRLVADRAEHVAREAQPHVPAPRDLLEVGCRRPRSSRPTIGPEYAAGGSSPQISRTVSCTTDCSSSKNRSGVLLRVTDRVAPVTAFFTVTVSVIVPPATLRLPPTSRLCAMSLSAVRRGPVGQPALAQGDLLQDLVELLALDDDALAGRLDRVEEVRGEHLREALPEHVAASESPPTRRSAGSTPAGCLTVTNAALAVGGPGSSGRPGSFGDFGSFARFGLRSDIRSVLRLPLRSRTSSPPRSTPALPRNGVVAAIEPVAAGRDGEPVAVLAHLGRRRGSTSVADVHRPHGRQSLPGLRELAAGDPPGDRRGARGGRQAQRRAPRPARPREGSSADPTPIAARGCGIRCGRLRRPRAVGLQRLPDGDGDEPDEVRVAAMGRVAEADDDAGERSCPASAARTRPATARSRAGGSWPAWSYRVRAGRPGTIATVIRVPLITCDASMTRWCGTAAPAAIPSGDDLPHDPRQWTLAYGCARTSYGTSHRFRDSMSACTPGPQEPRRPYTLILIAVLGTALAAGAFFAFSAFIMAGPARRARRGRRRGDAGHQPQGPDAAVHDGALRDRARLRVGGRPRRHALGRPARDAAAGGRRRLPRRRHRPHHGAGTSRSTTR